MIDQAKQRFPELLIPVVDGEFKLVYEPEPEHPNSWMVNDHCLIRDAHGTLHFFGIENPFPTTAEALEWLKDDLVPTSRPFIQTLHWLMHGHLYCKGKTHYRVGHAVAESVWGPWRRLPAAQDGGLDRLPHGSPFVVEHEGQYWMFEPSQGTGSYTSTDLQAWTPVADGTPWEDSTVFGPAGHRDPCIHRCDDGTYLQFFAANDAQGLNTIGLASSTDLRNWRHEEPCYVEHVPDAPFSGIFESPFVLRHGSLYYLFVGFSHRHYYETFVVVSADPRRFHPEHKITTMFTHAPEFIEIDGVTYMSSCGIEDPQCLNRSGLWMSRLRWLDP